MHVTYWRSIITLVFPQWCLVEPDMGSVLTLGDTGARLIKTQEGLKAWPVSPQMNTTRLINDRYWPLELSPPLLGWFGGVR